MIVGIGSDIFEVSRIGRELNTGDDSIMRELFTKNEILFCENMHYPERHYAARFAAKEAVFKALGTGKVTGMRWHDIEITHDEAGIPCAYLHGAVKDMAAQMKTRKVFVSLAHTRTMALATVILES
jgi:holo-[acyl-carrier protein] synthase